MRLIWIKLINSTIDRHCGGKDRPEHFGVGGTVPALEHLTRGFAAIRNEFHGLLRNKEPISRHHEIGGGQKYISGTIEADQSWRTFMFVSVMRPNESNMSRRSSTAVLLRSVPNLVSAFFSSLGPGKSIPAHEGGYRGLLRYRLGLMVPEVNPTRMRVKDPVHQRREGEHFLLDGSLNHEVINEAPTLRAVLIVDVLHRLPLLPHVLTAVAGWWMSRSNLYGKVNQAIEREARKMAQ